MPKLIAGLGNPGPRYANTRHNVGWMLLDAFARKHGVAVDQRGFEGLYGELRWGPDAEKVLLLKPLTYMNLSGRSVAQAARFFRIDPADVLVLHDDLDLEVGRLRLRARGSSGGHNGIKSIIAELGTEVFPRLKIGIGRPAPGWQVVDWVLAPFGPDDAATVAGVLPRAVAAVECFLTDGIEAAMNRYNSVGSE
ncbi:MAG: aminoacyl-tRNA hydrolase [Symbiobacterium sp.]|uniref:aminoacyl-tRNA hydrolase n=1 Tax=Symbiobacterium sp. TaxID=1971213 RepID=UPI00346470C9